MKRLIYLCLIFIISFCGCNQSEVISQKTPVTINMPTDNSVNGYRTEGTKDSDIIDANSVGVETKEESRPTNNTELIYCGNLNRKVFHYANCSSVKQMKEDNKYFCSDRNLFLEMDYTPCKSCNP